jgi:Protein of unknown function (DUF2934)
MQDLEQTVRERAYHLWLDGGCRDEMAEAHWLAAQREVLSAVLAAFGRVTAAKSSVLKGSPRHRRSRAQDRSRQIRTTK